MGTLVNSEDPDEMLQSVAFHLSLHCLPRERFFSKKENAILFGN